MQPEMQRKKLTRSRPPVDRLIFCLALTGEYNYLSAVLANSYPRSVQKLHQ